MEHNEWFNRITRSDSLRRVAELADISDRTLSRQLRAGEIDPALIIRIAEAYEESPVIALVDLGFMSSKWITEPGVVTALSRASDEELTDELLRRLNLLDGRPVDQVAKERDAQLRSLPDNWEDFAVADESPDHPEEDSDFD